MTGPAPSDAGRAAAKSGQGPLRLLWVGRLTFRKGAHHLFQALRELPPGSAQLTVVSEVKGDPLLHRLAPDGVRILGQLTPQQLREAYANADVFVMPSLVEGFGMVFLEALGTGLPIICTENTGGPDVMQSGSEGFVVEAGNVASLKSAIKTLAGDPVLLNEMSERARKAARAWTWPRFREDLRTALAQIESSGPIGSRPSARTHVGPGMSS
jgi:glycosyltransferase involved in cell wall biosynthesis